MTKFEWESELRKNIHKLPKSEIDQIFEYYNEIFNDKIESGMKEREIIAEFGNPIDVADKILSDYNISPADERAENPDYKPIVDTPVFNKDPEYRIDPEFTKDKEYVPSDSRKKKPKSEGAHYRNHRQCNERPSVSAWRTLGFIICTVLFGGLAIGLCLIAVSMIFAGVIGGAALTLGGLAGAVWYGSVITTSFYTGIVQIGLCIAISGAGILIAIIGVKLGKFAFRLGKRLFKRLGKFYTDKKEELYEN